MPARVAAPVEIVRLPDPSPAAALADLRARGVRAVLCEGGPTLNRVLLAAGLVDELFLTLEPLVTARRSAAAHRRGCGAAPAGARLALTWALRTATSCSCATRCAMTAEPAARPCARARRAATSTRCAERPVGAARRADGLRGPLPAARRGPARGAGGARRGAEPGLVGVGRAALLRLRQRRRPAGGAGRRLAGLGLGPERRPARRCPGRRGHRGGRARVGARAPRPARRGSASAS